MKKAVFLTASRSSLPASFFLGHIMEGTEIENPGAVERIDTGNDSASDAPQSCGPAALAGRVAAFPHLPGIYIFRDAGRAVLYVGKARDLRKRIGNYFRSGDAVDVKTRMMLGKAADLEYAVTSSEKEALLLEASLIKKYRPRYNVVLRDDKNYLSIRIDPRDPLPQARYRPPVSKRRGALFRSLHIGKGRPRHAEISPPAFSAKALQG